MILTKTTEYAIRILTFMASHNQKLFSAKYLHEQLDIPYKYLTRLMTKLSKHDCLKSVKGRNGGFYLNKKLGEITLANIIEVVEGMDAFNKCILGFDECSSENPCAIHFIWEKNKKAFLETLRKTTLKDITHMEIKKY